MNVAIKHFNFYKPEFEKMFRVYLLCYYVLTNTQLKTVQRQNI